VGLILSGLDYSKFCWSSICDLVRDHRPQKVGLVFVEVVFL